MTSKEALKKLKSMPTCSECELYGSCFEKPLCNVLYNTIKQDLDRLEEFKQKETPMKAIVYNINQYKCPKCLNQIKGKKMIYNMETKKFDIKSKIIIEKVYWPSSGQRLDWSECNDK